MAKDVIMAVDIYNTPEANRPGKLAEFNKKNKTKFTLSTILAPLGISVESSSSKLRVDGK